MQDNRSLYQNINSVVIKNDMQVAHSKIIEPILAQLNDKGYCKQDKFAIRLGLEEALSNAYKHGNKSDPNKTISAKWSVDEEKAVIWIADCGSGFNPNDVPDPRDDKNLEKPSGRGLLLIRAYMTEVSFNEKGNELRMMKKKSEKSDKAEENKVK